MTNYKTTEKGRALLRNKSYSAKVADAISNAGWNASGNYSVKIKGGEAVVSDKKDSNAK